MVADYDGASAASALQATDIYTVYIDGVPYTSAAAGATTAAAAHTAIAAVINTVLGAGTAVAGAGSVIVNAPTAGTFLPFMHITSSGTGGAGNVTLSEIAQNIAAVTSTTTAVGSVAASQFTGATSIAVDGNSTTVTALTTQSVTDRKSVV